MRLRWLFFPMLLLAFGWSSGQVTAPMFELESAAKHGVFLYENGFVGGYFLIRNISNDTLCLDRLYSSTGYCNFRHIGCKLISPNESRPIFFYADIGGQYHGNIRKMLQDTLKANSPRMLVLSIDYQTKGVDSMHRFSEAVPIWPLPISGAYCSLDSLLGSSWRSKADFGSFEFKILSPLEKRIDIGKDSIPIITVSGFLEISNPSQNSYLAIRIFATGNTQFEIVSLQDLELIRSHGSLVYSFSYRFLANEWDAIASSKIEVGVSLLIDVGEKETVPYQTKLGFDFSLISMCDDCH